jgi:electron transport complex protein RnfA
MDPLAALVVAIVLLDQIVLHGAPALPANEERRLRLRCAGAAALALTLAAPVAVLLDRVLLGIAGRAELRLPLSVLAVAACAAPAASLLRAARPTVVLLDATLLAAALLASRPAEGVLGTAAWAAGAGVAFALCTLLFADLRERLAQGEAPAALRGAALLLVSAGLFTLALSGFTGALR